MLDIVYPLQNITNKCVQVELDLSITNSWIKSLSGDVLENVSITNLYIHSNENLEDIDMKIFEASYNTLKLFEFKNNCPKCGTKIVENIKQFNNLQQLILPESEINIVPKGAFSHKNISFIYLAGSRIDLVDNYAFQLLNCNDCAKRVQIDLGSNYYSDNSNFSIARNAFASIERVIYLRLNSRKLVRLDEKTYRPLLEKSQQNTIEVDGNFFICDCLMKWTLEHNTTFVKQLNYAKCDDGKSLKDHWPIELADCRSTLTAPTSRTLAIETSTIPVTGTQTPAENSMVQIITANLIIQAIIISVFFFLFHIRNCFSKYSEVNGIKSISATVTDTEIAVTGVENQR
jgi:hypothetical protein